MQVSASTSIVERWQHRLNGPLLTPSHSDYHAARKANLSSHQLIDFMKCPSLLWKKREGLIADRDSRAYFVGRAAHKLKGASANLHLESITALSLDIETRARAGGEDTWQEDLRKLSAEFERITEVLRKVG